MRDDFWWIVVGIGSVAVMFVLLLLKLFGIV